jgi:hypothetical protein
MNHADFAHEMGRVIEVYGEKYYPSSRMEIIFKWANRLSVEHFSKIITEIISESERPPMLGKFKQVQQDLKLFNKAKTDSCIYCLGSGFIIEDFPGNNAYRCRCVIGQSLPDFIKTWEGKLVRKALTASEEEFAYRNRNSKVSSENEIKSIVNSSLKSIEKISAE